MLPLALLPPSTQLFEVMVNASPLFVDASLNNYFLMMDMASSAVPTIISRLGMSARWSCKYDQACQDYSNIIRLDATGLEGAILWHWRDRITCHSRPPRNSVVSAKAGSHFSGSALAHAFPFSLE